MTCHGIALELGKFSHTLTQYDADKIATKFTGMF